MTGLLDAARLAHYGQRITVTHDLGDVEITVDGIDLRGTPVMVGHTDQGREIRVPIDGGAR